MKAKEEIHWAFFHARQNPLTNHWLCTDDRQAKSFAFYVDDKREVKRIIKYLQKRADEDRRTFLEVAEARKKIIEILSSADTGRFKIEPGPGFTGMAGF